MKTIGWIIRSPTFKGISGATEVDDRATDAEITASIHADFLASLTVHWPYRSGDVQSDGSGHTFTPHDRASDGILPEALRTPMTNFSKVRKSAIPPVADRTAVALALINEQRTFHGLDAIGWDFPALSTPNKERALRQADAVIRALPATAKVEGGR